jgi:hypothetical protein
MAFINFQNSVNRVKVVNKTLGLNSIEDFGWQVAILLPKVLNLRGKPRWYITSLCFVADSVAVETEDEATWT